MPSVENEQSATSPKAGSPNNNGVSPVAAAAGTANLSALEEKLFLSVKKEPAHATNVAVDDDEDSLNAVPKSWSFAARQRFECARIVRVFRYARLRMRQTLRGLALDHAELLLGAVTRKVVEVAEGAGTTVDLCDGGSPRGERRQERLQAKDDGDFNIEGESDHQEPGGDLRSQVGRPPRRCDLDRLEEEEDEVPGVSGKDEQRPRRRSNRRHEARQCDEWNTQWALNVDEEDMGELTTLALDASVLEEITGGGLGAKAAEGARFVVEWRKAFRKAVILTGGSRHPTQRRAIWGYESRITVTFSSQHPIE